MPTDYDIKRECPQCGEMCRPQPLPDCEGFSCLCNKCSHFFAEFVGTGESIRIPYIGHGNVFLRCKDNNAN